MRLKMCGSSARSSRSCASFKSLWAGLLLLAFSSSGCLLRTVSTPEVARPPSPAVQIDAELRQRAAGLDAGDLKRYLASVAPAAQAFETQIGQGSLGVPILTHSLTVQRSSVTTDPAQQKDVRVDFLYTYQGLPADNLFRIPLLYDLTKVGKHWVVTQSRLDPAASLPMWATGPVKTARSAHFLAEFRDGVGDVQRTLDIAESARSRLAAKLTLPTDPSQLILLARNREEYITLSARETPVSAIAQAETSYEVTPDKISVQSRQIVVNLKSLYGGGSAVETLQHELGHLALATDTRPFTPAWVSESAAMFLAGTRPVALWKDGIRRRKFDRITFAGLNRASSLGQHDPTGEAASYEYAYAAGASWYLTETFGNDKYFEFYRSFATVPPNELFKRLPPGRIASQDDTAVLDLADATTADSLQKIFGFSESELDARVRGWISKQR